MVIKSDLPGKSAGKRRRLEPSILSQTQLIFMESCGRFSQDLGFSRSIGTLFGLLYLSPGPVGLGEIARLSGISKGSASMGTRQLLGMGLIRKKWIPSEKRDFYEAVPNPNEALRNLYRNMLEIRLESSQKKMKELTCMLESEKASLVLEDFKHISNQLKSLDRLRQKIARLMPAVDALL
jgi:DNA-binding transcriptional regulator GbsR (MarR family)